MSIDNETGFALIGTGNTSIGELIPHVVVSENYKFSLIMTDHPVETGAAITDHAFMRPKSITIRCGWSDATFAAVGGILQPQDQLIALMENREPFTVTTPRKQYDNMLPQDITFIRDIDNESILAVVVELRELIIVSTQTSGGTSASSGDTQANPENNAGTTDTGNRSLADGSSFTSSYDVSSNQDYLNGGAAGYSSINSTASQYFNGDTGFSGTSAGSVAGADAGAFGSSYTPDGLANGGEIGFSDGEATFTASDGTSLTGPGITVQTDPSVRLPGNAFGGFNVGQYQTPGGVA